MKNCTNCQAPINAGDAFCSKCGAKVQVAAQAEPKAVTFQPKTVQLGPTPTQAPAPKKTKRNMKGILAGIFVLLAIITVAGYFFFQCIFTTFIETNFDFISNCNGIIT